MSMIKQLLRTKSLDDLVAETQQEGHQLKKVLGPWNLVALGVGAIIGAGIFATIGTAAAGDHLRAGAGPALMLSFVLTAIVCAFTALCYAEFASMVPVSGSAYTYSYATLGELVAWIIGWDLIIEYAIGNVAVAISWANYFNTFIEGFGLKLPGWLAVDYGTAIRKMPVVVANAPHIFGFPVIFNLFAVLIVAAITVVLVWGIRESASFNFVMVAIKLVVLAFFVIVCFKYVRPENWHPFAPNGFKGIGAGAAIVFFAYIGFDAVSTTAEEAKNPTRDMPIGIIGSLIVCTIIYAFIAAIFTGLIPYHALVTKLSTEQAEPLTLAMKYVSMPGWMIGVVALGSVVAHTAVLLVFQLGQPRIFFAMSRDGLLPAWMAKVHPKYGTPHVATILTGVAVGVTAMFTSLDEMVDLTNIGTLFAFILVCMGIMILRIKDPARPRPFRVPGGTYLFPILGALSCIGLAYYLPPSSWMRFFVWLVVGLEVYTAYGLRELVYHGRLRRVGFAAAFFGVLLVSAFFYGIVWHYRAAISSPYLALVAIVTAALVLSGIAVVRRLHDLGRPGQHYWYMWIPVYDIYFLLMLLFKASDGPNEFDAPPRQRRGMTAGPARPYGTFNPEQQLPEADVR
jgi:APA family basic amino acid/polyamine antiporter